MVVFICGTFFIFYFKLRVRDHLKGILNGIYVCGFEQSSNMWSYLLYPEYDMIRIVALIAHAFHHACMHNTIRLIRERNGPS